MLAEGDVGGEMGRVGEVDGGDVETGEVVGLVWGDGGGLQVAREVAEPCTGGLLVSDG